MPTRPIIDLPQRLDSITPEQGLALSEFAEAQRKAEGARDAYATALVVYFDGLLKTLWIYFKKVPEVNQELTVGVRGIALGKIIHEAANNARHYIDWKLPGDMTRRQRRQSASTCRTIAAVLDKELPEPMDIARFGFNYSWEILVRLGGGTFDGLLAIVARYQDEMISNAGVAAVVGSS